MKEYYQILGIEPTATHDEVVAAYRRKAKEVRPDHGGSTIAFQELGNAYETLSVPAKRASYDAHYRGSQ